MVSVRNRRGPASNRGLPSILLILSHLVVLILGIYGGYLSGMTSCVCPVCPAQVPPPRSAPISPSSSSAIDQWFEGGATLVSRDDFKETLDVGVPLNPSDVRNNDVLIMYSSPKSKPTSTNKTTAAALQNCDTLKIILTSRRTDSMCMAVMGAWDSYQMQKWMRLPPKTEDGGLDISQPLRQVSRLHMNNGKYQRFPDSAGYFPMLIDYLQRLEGTLARLKPVAAKVAGTSNKIVTLVCNKGQSELLTNFICSAKGRNLDLSHVLVFGTDTETYDLATSLGVAAFDVQDAFGEMPAEAARGYADHIFRRIMLAKVYCVHMISELGYDQLFQDVDIVWYRNPLEYFDLDEAGDFDLYFQDDGSRQQRYAPYSPNSGFYYVRNNERTRWLWSQFMRTGDVILTSGSHQGALTMLLNEHASTRGLKIKVFARDEASGQLFPGGYHYHNRRSFVRDFIDGKEHPYIWHMSWTANHKDKKKYFQQMGDWYIKDECSGGDCCLSEPLFKCHYRDKPSTKPCKDSPPIDKNGRSFWP